MHPNRSNQRKQKSNFSKTNDMQASNVTNPIQTPLWAQGKPVQRQALTINQPDDPYEQEADSIAQQVMRMPEVGVQRCTCGGVAKDGEECPSCRAKRLQRSATGQSNADTAPASVHKTISKAGNSLDNNTRHFMEARFGTDFSGVRVHTDNEAAQSAADVQAAAYTVGNHVVFGRGQYQPKSQYGKQLLAHELTHTLQQAPVQIQLQAEDAEDKKPKIKYNIAKRRNIAYARKLGWNDRLSSIRPAWHALWNDEKYNEFADAVAAFQMQQGFENRSVSGILNSRTWDRLRPIGEVIAEQDATWPDSEQICYEASRERMQKGYKRATGESLVEHSEWSDYKVILRSNPSELKKAGIDKKYWGTSAAGAFVFLGQGTFIDASAIWDNKALEPGAILQIWAKKSDVERIKDGKKPTSWGTSAVFIKYIGDNKMRVKHFEKYETWPKSYVEFWLGANPKQRSLIGDAQQSEQKSEYK